MICKEQELFYPIANRTMLIILNPLCTLRITAYGSRFTDFQSWTPGRMVHYNARMNLKTSIPVGYVGILFLCLFALGAPHLLADEGQPFRSDMPTHSERPEMGSLNIRLSQHPISAPEHLVKGNVDLTEVRAARMMVGPSPKAAILENDHHERVLILSTLEDERVRAQLLTDIDFSSRIPLIVACAHDRECAYDRRPVTGGLGCIAICVQQALKPNPTP